MRAAINKNTAMAVSGGHHFLSQKKIQTADTDVPIKTRKMRRSERLAGRIDLRGIKFGRFTVIGISAMNNKNWVVRCQCGVYSERKSRSVLNPKNQSDMCELCRENEHLKKVNHFQTYGVHKN